MGINASVGVGQGDDSYTVGANACQDAIDQLSEKNPDLLIVFSSVKYDQEKMLQGVRSVAPEAMLVGSSTSGEITTQGPLKDNSVVVMAIKSPEIKYFTGVGENIKVNPRAAGKEAADKVKAEAGPALKAFLMIPDVLAGNGADIVRGVLDSLGTHFPVVGGASGDDFAFKKTYQYLNDKVYSGAVVGLGLTGNFKIGIGVKHGWIPVGEPVTVTKSSGSVIHEIDGKPAIKIYEDYFGEEEAKVLRTETLAKLAITYPLGMKVAGSDELLIRDPITVDEHGSITCAEEIPEGSVAIFSAHGSPDFFPEPFQRSAVCDQPALLREFFGSAKAVGDMLDVAEAPAARSTGPKDWPLLSVTVAPKTSQSPLFVTTTFQVAPEPA